MNLRGSWPAFLAIAGTFVGTAMAQSTATYRCVDSSGRSTYTNVKEEMSGKKCTVVSREVSVVPAQAAPKRVEEKAAPRPGAPAGASAPNQTASRATDRRRILEEELSDEHKRLEQAKQKLAEQQSIRSGDERNYQRVLDRLKPFEDAVQQHERNVEQLKRELGAAR